MNQDPSIIAFVPLVSRKVTRVKREGLTHERFQEKYLTGTLTFVLENTGYLLVSAGHDLEGCPLPSSAPKTFQLSGERPVIPGSTLKGCFRALFEATTHSCLRLLSLEYKDRGHTLSRPEHFEPLNRDKSLRTCHEIERLCPACLLFGTACDNGPWQGRVRIGDALLQNPQPRFAKNLAMPKQEVPRPKQRTGSTRFTDYYPEGRMAGRKFYRRTLQPGRTAQLTRGAGRGPVPATPLLSGHQFRFRLDYRNLTEPELGALLAVILLPQDCCHAIGSAKNHGWGSCTIRLETWQEHDLQRRYRGQPQAGPVTASEQAARLAQLERAAQSLLVTESLHQLHAILRPT